MKAPDDSTLQKLWRKVVRWDWDNKCALWNIDEHLCNGFLECHHIIPRARPHLRHAPANGILLCAYHHNGVQGWSGEIARLVGDDKMEWLRLMQRQLFKDFLLDRGQTKAEWLIEQKAYLQGLKSSRSETG